MISAEKLYNTFLDNGVDFFTGVPDSLLKNICAYITDHTSKESHIIAANEGCAIGIASGHYMATGNIPLVYMQNSGLGNTVNPLLSLADEKVYSLPILLMIGWRGEPGIKDEPQHIKQGAVTLDLLDAMQIPYVVLDFNEGIALKQITDIVGKTKETSKPHAIVIRKNTFEEYELMNRNNNSYPMSREDAMKIIVNHTTEKDVIVSTTGKLSRELFEYREEMLQSHKHDFLTVGSMGHSSSIALGIALAKPNKRIFCFDGDGAFIMHMGSISNIANLAPQNYIHILFNNGAHESVGGQPTLGLNLDLPKVAAACGYKNTFSTSNEKELENVLKQLNEIKGPTLIEVKVHMNSRENLGRPTTTPIQNKEAFMNFLKEK